MAGMIINLTMQRRIEMAKCSNCKNDNQTKKDMEQKFTNKLLCDDCYTEVRILVANFLNVNLQDLDL